MNKRMDRSKLHIGTYILKPYARTEQHYKDLAEAGIDWITSYSAPTVEELDLLKKYGLGIVLVDRVPFWWGGDGDKAGKYAETYPDADFEKAAKGFIDHPAIWAIDVGDEPSALDFPRYGQVIDRVEKLFPNQFAYLNLYPNYASVSQNNAQETVNQLGTATYGEHIQRYIENVPTDYICYDFYVYSATVHQMYENLRIVADACRKTGRDMWIVLQVNSHKPEKWITENMLRYQAFSSMVFGAQNIIWACWTAGWWHNQVLDDQGKKTPQYEKLKKVNYEILTFADKYMEYRSTASHFVGFAADSEDLQGVQQTPIAELNTGVFFGLKGAKPLLVGEMAPRRADGSHAVMLCDASDPMDQAPGVNEVSFRVGGDRRVTVYCGKGEYTLAPDEQGVYHLPLASCDGALLVTE